MSTLHFKDRLAAAVSLRESGDVGKAVAISADLDRSSA